MGLSGEAFESVLPVFFSHNRDLPRRVLCSLEIA